MIFGFVTDEIAPVATGSDHALLTLAAREGRPAGQTRLLVTLLRGAGIPARPVLGLRMRSDASLTTEVWAEAWLADRWAPMSPSQGFFGHRPADLLVLRTDSLDLIESAGIEAVGYRYRGRREELRPEELATLMVPDNPLLEKLSLYRLTLRGTSLTLGLGMVVAVIALGIASRLILQRLRLLLVPRLAILLCVVVLGVVGLALLGEGLGERDLAGAVLFPMVILTMLVERFSVTLEEEGARSAMVRAGYTVLVAVMVYPIFRSERAEHVMFSFPELVISLIGLLVLTGGYTGYRISDLIRFRALVRVEEPLS
jgi:hypothetical protein